MNKPFNQMKQDYDQLSASESLKNRISGHFAAHKAAEEAAPAAKFPVTVDQYVAARREARRKKQKQILKPLMGIAAALIIGFTASLNLIPSFAESVSQIPGLSGIVQVLTFGKYEIHQGGFEANVETPKIEGLLDKSLQDQLNAEFKDNADAVIASFESDMKALQAAFPNQEVHIGMDSGYEVRTNNSNYLVLDVWIVNTAGSSSTVHKFYTIDKHTQSRLKFADLFKSNVDFIKPLDAYIIQEMKRQKAAGEADYWVDQPEMMPAELVKPDQSFFINDQGQLVICFEKYEIAPGYIGNPEFVIPHDVSDPLLIKSLGAN